MNMDRVTYFCDFITDLNHDPPPVLPDPGYIKAPWRCADSTLSKAGTDLKAWVKPGADQCARGYYLDWKLLRIKPLNGENFGNAS